MNCLLGHLDLSAVTPKWLMTRIPSLVWGTKRVCLYGGWLGSDRGHSTRSSWVPLRAAPATSSRRQPAHCPPDADCRLVGWLQCREVSAYGDFSISLYSWLGEQASAEARAAVLVLLCCLASLSLALLCRLASLSLALLCCLASLSLLCCLASLSVQAELQADHLSQSLSARLNREVITDCAALLAAELSSGSI